MINWNPFRKEVKSVDKQIFLERQTLVEQNVQRLADLKGLFSQLLTPSDTGQYFARNVPYYVSLYKRHPIVRAAIDKRATLVAAPKYLSKDPLFDRLINNPSKDQSVNEFFKLLTTSRDVAGNSYFFITWSHFSNPRLGQHKKYPVALTYMDPARTAVREQDGYYHYVYSSPYGGERIIEAEDMLHIVIPQIENSITGESILSPLVDTIETDFKEQAWQSKQVDTNRKDVIMKFATAIMQTHKDDIQKEWRNRKHDDPFVISNQGSAPGSAPPPLPTIERLDPSSEEIQYVESRFQNWKVIAGVLEMSLSVLGFTDDVNLANGEVQQRQLYENSIIPLINSILSQINRQIGQYFTDPLEVDFQNVPGYKVSDDQKAKRINMAKELFNLGVPFEQLNKQFDLGTTEFNGWDISYTSPSLIPNLDMDLPEIPLDSVPVEEQPETEPKDPVDTTADAAPVANSAMNGAQIASLLDILAQVTSKQIPPEAAIAIMKASFPALDDNTINNMIEPLRTFNAPQPPSV